MSIYKVIGLMSGTSLDGLDIAYCEFAKNQSWEFRIIKAETISYSNEWQQKLKNISNYSKIEISKTDVEYGQLLGQLVRDYISDNNITPDFIASHGHTVFHQPEIGLTLQIGDGNEIVKATNLPVIYDFRTLDVSLGGQGAPLVPIGDRLIFPDYGYCLNLGGIANISFEKDQKRIAFDICPTNIVLNHLSGLVGFDFDNKGKLASHGCVNKDLLQKLNELDFYKLKAPKSLGKEWIDINVFPLLEQSNISTLDQLRTIIEHIAMQIRMVVNNIPGGKVLVTGGGAYNDYLINRLREISKAQFVLPDKNIIEFKEALIFGFLGALRWRNEINCLASVTGAQHDSSSGVILLPKKK